MREKRNLNKQMPWQAAKSLFPIQLLQKCKILLASAQHKQCICNLWNTYAMLTKPNLYNFYPHFKPCIKLGHTLLIDEYD